LTVHIINHTHWDREWFLTSAYTSRWIPGLIERLEELAARNPHFRYLFDGQTLVLEDLAAVSPAHLARAEALIRAGNLTVGPYYCQPDWKLTDGELLIRNLLYGQRDTQKHGGAMQTGWLVDTFGHISQAPQIHRRFGIDAVYIWRGAPQLTPYLRWVGAGQSELLAINLFGGYRNLYGVSHAPTVAAARLHGEVNRLRSYYPMPDIPLFDGYDLEDNPEDPLRFFADTGDVDPVIRLTESTPATFAAQIAAKQLPLPVVEGELNSGKYGATFPGTLSARTYLKVMAHDSMSMALRYAEPLAVLAWLRGRTYPTSLFETWSRQLLQNAVHDCICGVSIDQVHEKMEDIYRRIFDAAHVETRDALSTILQGFTAGFYAISTTPLALDGWQRTGDRLLHMQTKGIGVFPVTEHFPVERVKQGCAGFTWQNDHYAAHLRETGEVRVGHALLGALVVRAEEGDTYSDETGDVLGMLHLTARATIIERSTRHAVISYNAAWEDGDRWAKATVLLTFDPSPLIRWQIDLETRGSDLCVELRFATAQHGAIYAGMPFDVVQRPPADSDLLPRTVEDDLTKILLGQRELNGVTTFPFHDVIAIDDGVQTTAVLARGLRAYTAEEDGVIRLPLQRAVEWLTKADLKNRIGDAGPFFYVPDARGERHVRHEVAVAIAPFRADSMQMQTLNAAFQTPPLLVETQGDGVHRQWDVLCATLPMSALQVSDGAPVARLYNPTTTPEAPGAPLVAIDGQAIDSVPAKGIVEVRIEPTRVAGSSNEPAEFVLLASPAWRVGPNQGKPDAAILAWLVQRIAGLAAEIERVEAAASAANGDEQLRLQHRYYALAREQMEFRLSLELNRRKIAAGARPDEAYLYGADEEIAAIGLALNHLRIKRRIFDYVVAALP
ncbi:MAG: hypothetical protein R6W76_10365, partial [Caldilinea sp.]